MSGSTLYDVRVAIAYRYGSRVPFAKHMLRIEPETGDDQRVLESRLEIDPPPSGQWPDVDHFGNRTRMFALDLPHERLEVRLAARVEVRAAGPVPASPP